MPPEYRVISLGTLAVHPLWKEKSAARTPHATTTLVSTEDEHILVNPSLPGQILHARIAERAPVAVEDISHVFLTSLELDHCRGLSAFPEATWLAFEPELTHVRDRLHQQVEGAREAGDEEAIPVYESQIELLEKVQPAPDRLVDGVDLFPLPGVTPGTCGLLVAQPRATVLISGDAVATGEHLAHGQVLPHCADVKQAQESFREAIEIADVIIPGRDNVQLR
ncbi:MAG: hypothetical protein CMJ39_12560 [Phycisphaerae bacterium]|nr:hypothetical protein [Phycisphaerae bacterium]